MMKKNENSSKRQIYFQLFWSTLKISMFTNGGGYAIVPMLKRRFADDLRWIDGDEMLDLISLAQSSPGPIAVSASVLIGYRMAGFTGAWITVFATILPPLLFLSVVSVFYDAFRKSETIAAVMTAMQIGSAATIVGVVISMSFEIIKKKDILPIAVMAGAFVASSFFHISAIVVILVCCSLGILLTLLPKGFFAGRRKRP